MAVWIYGIGLLFLTVIVSSIVMYFHSEDDMWFQMLWAITGFSTFIFMIPFAYQVSQVQMGVPETTEVLTIDDVDLDNLNFTSEEVMTSSIEFFVYNWDDIDETKETLYTNADFCFYYNNSDANPNVVRAVNGEKAISDYVYLPGLTEGIICTHINGSLIFSHMLLGIGCEDCTVPNPLNFPKVLANNLTEIHIARADPTSYTLSIEQPHVYYLELKIVPYDQVNDWFWLYVFWCGFLFLGFMIRGVIMVIIRSSDVMLR